MKSSLIWGGWFLLCAVILVGSSQSPSATNSGNRARPDSHTLPTADVSQPQPASDRFSGMRQ